MSSSGCTNPPPPGRIEVVEKLQISRRRKIKKPPLPNPAKPPVIIYEPKDRIICLKTPADFMYIVQLLTGDPNLPPPVYKQESLPECVDRPLGILSPTPNSLPSVSQNAFTPPPPPPPPPDSVDVLFPTPQPPADSVDVLFPTPPPCEEELSIYDHDWEENPAYSPNNNLNIAPLPSPNNYFNFPPYYPNFNSFPPPPS